MILPHKIRQLAEDWRHREAVAIAKGNDAEISDDDFESGRQAGLEMAFAAAAHALEKLLDMDRPATPIDHSATPAPQVVLYRGGWITDCGFGIPSVVAMTWDFEGASR